MNIKKWELKELDKAHATTLAARYNLPSLLAMLLEIRDYASEEQIQEILYDKGDLSDPCLIQDMDLAVARIQKAIDNFERIAVYGDYDADGITATAILFSYLDTVGADVMYYIPQREGEGYGLNMGAVEHLAEKGVNLIITVDNGISSVEEVKRANELHIDVVVTDHHQPHETLPPAVAVVDPHRKDCGSPFKELCGAGVVLKLLMALENGDQDMIMAEYADLAALGTIADVVSVTGENRIIIKNGLEILSARQRPGLAALLEKSGCNRSRLTARMLAFTLVPRINATGRMGDPKRAVRLLTCEYEHEAEELAEEICEENNARKSVEANILEEAIEQIESSSTRRYDRVLVVDGEGWHHGVVGIVAARIMERYGKPTLVISRSLGEARGSGRSIDGFSLFDAISDCEELLTKYGGHPMAVGVSLPEENIELFRIKINKYAKNVYYDMPSQTLLLDCKLNPAVLSVDMANSLTSLEPFGAENPYPLFGLYRMRIDMITPVGGGGHLRLSCSRDGALVTAMCFGTRLENFPYIVDSVVDLAVTLEAKEFRGETQLTVQVKDIRYTEVDTESCIHTYQLYEMFKRGEAIKECPANQLIPTRDELAAVYRYLLAGKERQHLLTILHGINRREITLGKLLVCLDIFVERELADCKLTEGWLVFTPLRHTGNKINIYDSEIFTQIKALVKV